MASDVPRSVEMLLKTNDEFKTSKIKLHRTNMVVLLFLSLGTHLLSCYVLDKMPDMFTSSYLYYLLL